VSKIAPLQFTSILKEKVWGGREMWRVLGQELPPGKRIGESWEISAHPPDLTRVAAGPLAGLEIPALVERFGEELLGRRVCARGGAERFPLLYKFLDAEERLSVQVHPDDGYARSHEGGEAGKAEAWVVLAAKPGARIWCGLEPGVSRADLARAVAGGRIEECLHSFAPRAGDCVALPAGTVHAVGGGVLFAEIEQSSDLTYRLHDWGREAADGSPLRPLHVEQALEVIDFKRTLACPLTSPGAAESGGALVRARLWECEHFLLERLDLRGAAEIAVGPESFEILSCVSGSGRLAGEGATGGSVTFSAGTTFLLPAALRRVSLAPDGTGETSLLRMAVP